MPTVFSNPKDTPGITAARTAEVDAMRQWVAEARRQL